MHEASRRFPARMIGLVLLLGCTAAQSAPLQTASAAAAWAASTVTPEPQARTAQQAPPPKVKAQPTVAPRLKPAAPPPLDLKALQTRLTETSAIGLFSKLALKNQIDDLLARFRALYQGLVATPLAELRQAFDMLVMKTLALLQDADPPLAGALSSSRESIWGILSDRAKFETI